MRTLLFLFVLAVPSLAAADAIGPEPTDCPAGSDAIICHGPPTCAALHCTSDGDCDPGLHCAPLALCTESHSCGGILGAPVYDHAISDCNASGGCAEGTCMNGSFCVPDGTDAGAGMDGGSGTDAGGELDSGAGIDGGEGSDSGAATDAPIAEMDTGGGGADTGRTVVTSGSCGCRAGSRMPGGLAILGVAILGLALVRRRV